MNVKVIFIMSVALTLGACGGGEAIAPADGGDDVTLDGGTDAASPDGPAGDAALADPSDARSIAKFVTSLPMPPVYVPSVVTGGDGKVRHEYAIDVRETVEQVLPPGYPTTKAWGYGAAAKGADGTIAPSFRGWPGATFEATRGVPVRVTWTNALQGGQMFAVDPTLHWADPNGSGTPMPPFAAYPPGYPSAQSSVPLVAHLHGGEVPSASDGFPLAWATAGGKHGEAYGSVVAGQTNAMTFEYPNTQRATTLWYHDHALGITRINVMSGLAGFYLLRDPADALASSLPSGVFEVPIVIQDRSFRADGSLDFPSDGVNPDVHPYWAPEFFGDAIVVNGRTWPNLDVQPRQYRLRMLNGSNARFYNLRLVDDAANTIKFTQIGTDGGYLPKPVVLDALLLAPGERADLLVDFSGSQGQRLRFVNNANAPYPGGDPPDPETSGQIMRFTVLDAKPTVPPTLPSTLVNIARLTPDQPTRILTLLEVEGKDGPLVSTLNGQHWDAPVSETPRMGSTEDWQIVDLTDDAHPIHLHLVQFQLVKRQTLDAHDYKDAWTTLNGTPTFPVMTSVKALDPTAYLNGPARGPNANELGWKDTLVVMPGEVTTIRIRFAPADVPSTGTGSSSPGTNLFGFDPKSGPGYVWHCHILDHEDNEMMRPLSVRP
jgi:FtsP/CotA-like multicopper oxidase with cupredoxin domain